MLCFQERLFSGLALETIVTRGFNSIGKKKEQKKTGSIQTSCF